jgi:hypothetical protein
MAAHIKAAQAPCDNSKRAVLSYLEEFLGVVKILTAGTNAIRRGTIGAEHDALWR